MKELEVALMSDAVAFGFRQFLNSLCVLCVLCVSAVKSTSATHSTTETQR